MRDFPMTAIRSDYTDPLEHDEQAIHLALMSDDAFISPTAARQQEPDEFDQGAERNRMRLIASNGSRRSDFEVH